MSKIEKILSIILVCLFLVSMTSCVSKKKFKESQALQSTYILDQTETKFSNSVQNLKSEIKQSTVSTVKEILTVQKESTSTNENESTSITGTLPPGEKETSVTVGNTTIKNNGGNVSFDIKSSRQLTKDLETINQELTQRYNLMESTLISVVNEFNEFKVDQLKINEDLKTQSETKNKSVITKGLVIGVIIFLVILAIGCGVYIYFKFGKII